MNRTKKMEIVANIPTVKSYVDCKVENLQQQINDIKPKPQKYWYSEPGVWLAIILTGVVIYLIYVQYMSDHGFEVYFPQWILDAINSFWSRF